jgi:hypothetical protein
MLDLSACRNSWAVSLEVLYCPHAGRSRRSAGAASRCRGWASSSFERHRLDPSQCIYVGTGPQDPWLRETDSGSSIARAGEFFASDASDTLDPCHALLVTDPATNETSGSTCRTRSPPSRASWTASIFCGGHRRKGCRLRSWQATMAAGDLALMALEVPTGWFADRFGSRRQPHPRIVPASRRHDLLLAGRRRSRPRRGLFARLRLPTLSFRRRSIPSLSHCIALGREASSSGSTPDPAPCRSSSLAALTVGGGAIVTTWGFSAGLDRGDVRSARSVLLSPSR